MPSSIQAIWPRAARAEADHSISWVEDTLAHIDRQIALLGSPEAQEWFLRQKHAQWTAAASRRACKIGDGFEYLDDHLSVIAGISARLRAVT